MRPASACFPPTLMSPPSSLRARGLPDADAVLRIPRQQCSGSLPLPRVPRSAPGAHAGSHQMGWLLKQKRVGQQHHGPWGRGCSGWLMSKGWGQVRTRRPSECHHGRQPRLTPCLPGGEVAALIGASRVATSTAHGVTSADYRWRGRNARAPGDGVRRPCCRWRALSVGVLNPVIKRPENTQVRQSPALLNFESMVRSVKITLASGSGLALVGGAAGSAVVVG